MVREQATARRSTTEAAQAAEVPVRTTEVPAWAAGNTPARGGGIWGCGGGHASRTSSTRGVLEEEEARLLLPEVRSRASRGRIFELRGSNFFVFVLAG
jgi:hypothetical protein